MDLLDRKIIWHLDQNARMPMVELAKRAGVSKQLLNYRLHKLIDDGVIISFIAGVDIHRIGFFTHRVYFRFRYLDSKAEEEIFDYFVKHSHTLWVVSIAGAWDAEVVFTARNFIHFNNLLKKVKLDLGKHLSKYNISMSPVSYALKRDYLTGAKRVGFQASYYGFEPEPGKWDALDFKLLAEISQDCRQSKEDLAKKLKVTSQTVKLRLKKLEQGEIIRSYRLRLDMDKLQRQYLKILLYLKDLSKRDEEKLYRFCAQWNFVIYLTEVLGDWQLEVETEVESQEELAPLIQALRARFPEQVADYEILHVRREYKMNYFPMGGEG